MLGRKLVEGKAMDKAKAWGGSLANGFLSKQREHGAFKVGNPTHKYIERIT